MLRTNDRTAAKLKEVKLRYRRKAEAAADYPVVKNGPPLAVRIKELNRLFRRRYGYELLDDDDGRDSAWLMASHLAHRLNGPGYYVAKWTEVACPWMEEDERESLIAKVLANPHRFTADTLARRLNVTEAERTELRLTTIGSIDKTSAERKADRKARKRVRDRRNKQHQRRTEGRKTRTEYEEQSLRNTKPWVALGISERTWYRRQERAASAPH